MCYLYSLSCIHKITLQTHTHTHKGAGSFVHTLHTFSLHTAQLIYGKCDCQFHDPATVLYVRPLVPWHTHTPTQTHTSRRPVITRRNMSCHAKDVGVHGLSLGLIGWELSNDHGGSEQGPSLPPKINFNQRGDAILSNVKSTAALGPVLQQKIIPDSHLAT